MKNSTDMNYFKGHVHRLLKSSSEFHTVANPSYYESDVKFTEKSGNLGKLGLLVLSTKMVRLVLKFLGLFFLQIGFNTAIRSLLSLFLGFHFNFL